LKCFEVEMFSLKNCESSVSLNEVAPHKVFN
jgi:hypothetical protein